MCVERPVQNLEDVIKRCCISAVILRSAERRSTVMPLYRFWRLRKIIRDTTTPIPLHQAEKWDRRLDRAYKISAFSAFVLVLYIYREEQKAKRAKNAELGVPEETNVEYYVRTLGLRNVNLVKYSLTGKVLLRKHVDDAEDLQKTYNLPAKLTTDALVDNTCSKFSNPEAS